MQQQFPPHTTHICTYLHTFTDTWLRRWRSMGKQAWRTEVVGCGFTELSMQSPLMPIPAASPAFTIAMATVCSQLSAQTPTNCQIHQNHTIVTKQKSAGWGWVGRIRMHSNMYRYRYRYIDRTVVDCQPPENVCHCYSCLVQHCQKPFVSE